MAQRPMSGILSKNDRKEKNAHPDYRGEVNVDGTEFWLSAWIKEGKDGKFLSLALRPKEEAARPAARAGGAPSGNTGAGSGSGRRRDDDIPFGWVMLMVGVAPVLLGLFGYGA